MAVVTDKPTSPRIARKRQAKMHMFMDAARDILAKKGLDGLTIQEIADKTDHAIGALYRYFSSKEALINQLQLRWVNELHEDLVSELDKTAGSEDLYLYRILLSIDAFLKMAQKDPVVFGSISRTTADPIALLEDDSTQEVLTTATNILQLVADQIVLAAKNAQLTIPFSNQKQGAFLMSTMMRGTVQGCAQLSKVATRSTVIAKQKVEVVKLSQQATLTLIRGWQADEQALQSAIKRLKWPK